MRVDTVITESCVAALVAPYVIRRQFDEAVRLASGRVIPCSVIARGRPGFLVLEHVESLASVMANKAPVVLQGEDVIARLAGGEMSRLTSLAERMGQ
jgi:hypothetical protein